VKLQPVAWLSAPNIATVSISGKGRHGHPHDLLRATTSHCCVAVDVVLAKPSGDALQLAVNQDESRIHEAGYLERLPSVSSLEWDMGAASWRSIIIFEDERLLQTRQGALQADSASP
jgi:hypothetical protein